MAGPPAALRVGEARGRWVLLATVLGSGMAMLDATIVNVALPAIGKDLDAGIAGLQWTSNGYVLTLAALILLGGSLGDRLGRRRVFVAGVVWFAAASMLCALAPTVGVLVAARALQGIGGALLTPGSLAIIQSAFVPQDRGRAIGMWAGLGGVASAIGPFAGGWLIETFSWRWAFLINAPIAAVVLVVTLRHVPESRDASLGQGTDDGGKGPLDLPGAALTALTLGLSSWGLITWADHGVDQGMDVGAAAALAGSVLAGVAFVVVEGRSRYPMVPLSLFAVRAFSATNVVTLLVYAALGGVFFFLVLTLQEVCGFSPVAAGAALLPVTVVMLVMSPRVGALTARIGGRWPMTVGPLVASAGVLWLSHIDAGSRFLVDVVPPVTVLGIGLGITVTPLTTTVLAAAPDHLVGVASGVNNAVARAGTLLTVAALPLVVGLSGEAYRTPALLAPAFRSAMVVCAGLLVVGALVAAIGLRTDVAREV